VIIPITYALFLEHSKGECTMSKYKYGCKKDSYDHRDVLRAVRLKASIPTSVDLRKIVKIPVYDQKDIGSCTSNALAAAHLFAQKTTEGSGTAIEPSRLDIYYRERELEGTINEDAGAMIRDGIKVLASGGVCPENLWPYVISKFKTPPPANATAAEKQHKILTYARVQASSLAVKQAIADNDPVVIGITLYASFEAESTLKTGIVPMPKKSETALGGHCVLLVGYDDAKKTFILQNSWGTGVGDKGFFYLPYDYIDIGLGSDFWTIKSAT
jgi:C1A family cysteine protease